MICPHCGHPDRETHGLQSAGTTDPHCQDCRECRARFQVSAVPITDERFLRRCIFRPYRRGMGPVFVLDAWDTYRHDSMGKSILGYRLTQTRENARGSDVIFQAEDYHCSPMHAIDSDAAVAGIMGFLTLKPGDTDREHFDDYTEVQMTFCESHGEALDMDVRARFEEEGREG